MPLSGSFVCGDLSGRVRSFTTIPANLASSQSLQIVGFIPANLVKSSSIASSFVRNRGSTEPGSIGAIEGIAFSGVPTTIDGAGSFGRHMQVGINKELSDGTPSPPSLRIDYPGMWRFRWVVKNGSRSISVSAKQNSTGSYRPTLVVKANPNINIPYDLSASAANGSGWIVMGPITFTTSGSDVLWVELHNNNTGVANNNAILVYAPAYFDHIVAS